MPVSMPYFSIVIPTRNRSSLLQHALSSVLGQTDTDFEVIVSDNWSTDQTPEVVRSAGREREVKLVRPPKALPMADHWNFAACHATGQWLLLLGDDDYFSRDLLATVRRTIERSDTSVITWHSAVYHHNMDIPESELRRMAFVYEPSRVNKLDLMSWTGQTYDLDARRQLGKLYCFENIVAPSGHVSALRSDLIEDVVGWAGSLFHPPYPDFGCSAAVLATAQSMTYIDLPLHLLGRVPRVGKFSYLLSSNEEASYSEAFAAEYASDDLFEGQPLQSPALMTTNMAASLERVRRLMPASIAPVTFDWKKYFLRCRLEIAGMTEAGVDTGRLVEQYDEALARQPATLQKEVRSGLSRFPAVASGVSRLKSTQAAHSLRRLLYSRRDPSGAFPDRADLPRWRSTIDGRQAGFADIAQAAAHVDRLRATAAKVAFVATP